MAFDEIARCWWDGLRLSSGTRDERKAWSLGEPPDVAAGCRACDEILGQGGEGALELILAMLRVAPEGDVGMVGAGPLETLIIEHGNELSRRIDDLARQSADFRRALSSVWLSMGELEPEACQRLGRWVPYLDA